MLKISVLVYVTHNVLTSAYPSVRLISYCRNTIHKIQAKKLLSDLIPSLLFPL